MNVFGRMGKGIDVATEVYWPDGNRGKAVTRPPGVVQPKLHMASVIKQNFQGNPWGCILSAGVAQRETGALETVGGP